MIRFLGSLRFRLAALNLVVFGFILFTLFVVILTQRERQLVADFDRWLIARSEHVLHELLAHSPDGPLPPESPFDPLHSHEYYFQIRDADGTLIRKSPNLRDCELPLGPHAREGRKHQPAIETIFDDRIAQLPEGSAGVRLLTIYNTEPGRAPFYLQTGATLEHLQHTIAEQRRLLLVLFPIGLLAVGTGSWMLAARALRPVRMVAEDASKLTIDQLGKRLRAGSGTGDISTMIDHLNQMLDRIEKGFRAQERFLAEVSHELRTPIAVLLGQAQVLARKARTPEEYDEFVASVESEMHRLSEIITSFLLMARANAGFRTAMSEVVSLNEVVTRAVQRCHVLASHREVTVVPRLSMPEGASGEPELKGDEELLTSMLSNLVMNAVRYSPVGETVEVTLVVEGPDALITVGDRGPGIPPDLLQKVFEPFMSVSKCGAKGTGLGLAIARSVAEFHGGSLAALNQPSGGCVFTVRLPIATAPLVVE